MKLNKNLNATTLLNLQKVTLYGLMEILVYISSKIMQDRTLQLMKIAIFFVSQFNVINAEDFGFNQTARHVI